MNGVMNSLNSNKYDPSYDIDALNKYSLEQLSSIKLEIESELHKLSKVLEANNSTMSTTLFTEDGFPRSDIDVVEVRTARAKIIKLKNDLTKLIEVLGLKLQETFSTSDSITRAQTSPKVPFAIASMVLESGPAHKAGLLVDDKICSFGEINATNHNNLQALPAYVKKNENKPVAITILRKDLEYTVNLVPTTDWLGNGLLGCKLTQI